MSTRREAPRLAKKLIHAKFFNYPIHFFPGWALLKAGRRLQKLGQFRQVADGVQKYTRNTQYPMDAFGNGVFIGQRFIPCAATPCCIPPISLSDRLDRLHGNLTLMAIRGEVFQIRWYNSGSA